MIRRQPLTAIVPVRGGSRGIPGKNLRRIGADTLLERAIKLGLRSPWVDRVIVSTDDPEMYSVAKRYGAASPALRPAHLATETATTVAVVQHLVAECMIAEGFLLLLQATAPLRTLADLDGLCQRYEERDADAIVSLVAIDEPRPEKLKRISGEHVFPYFANAYEGPRQSLPQPYALNGAFYLISLEAFLREGGFLPRSTLAYVMPPERSHNLDTITDWNILEAMVRAGHWAVEEYGQ